jgi:histidyl-tRNA synthetase
MKDLYGIDFRKYDYIVRTAQKVAEKYGYEMISAPIIEHTEVFQRAIGDNTDIASKEMYTFLDKGGDSITLRPEGTAGVIRAIVTNSLTQNLPVRLMYYGEMFRYDRPQKGRYRQFRQLGVEYLGDKSPYTDSITIATASEILNAIGIFDFEILVNSLGDDETREAYIKAIVKYFSRHKNRLSQDSQIRLQKNPLRILDSKDRGDIEICSMAPRIMDYFSKDAGNYFDKVCELLEKYGVKYEVDPFLVRGLDYYSHTAFEFKPTKGEYKDSIGGGGRYDKLLSQFNGPDVSGIGFAFGIERLMLLLDNQKFKGNIRRVAVTPVTDKENDIAFELFKTLHACDIAAEFLHVGNLSKKMKVADRLNCEITLLIGENERANGTVTVKFMNVADEARKTKEVNINEIVGFIKYALERS